MKLHRFNPDGMREFVGYRASLALDPTLPPPFEMLEDAALTDPVLGDVEVPRRGFTNRLEAGRFLNDLLDTANVRAPERDAGLWSWLTLFYFNDVCPADGHGRRRPQDEARLIPILDNHQRFYRHLLLGPFLIVRAHRDQPDRAIAMLCNPLWKPGEIVEQLASRKELVTNRAIVELATKLYYDPATGSFKRGAGSSVKGAPRRLAALFNQLDLTWYLYGMNTDEVLHLLPKEFDRFRAAG
ncbi:MAG: hypothetical protein QOH01_793 [Verrucomicrobiota bacterium]|jgi:hypothetical protein